MHVHTKHMYNICALMKVNISDVFFVWMQSFLFFPDKYYIVNELLLAA